MLTWVFLIVVLAIVGKLVYDVQQKKKLNQLDELAKVEAQKFVEEFQKKAGIRPVNKNDEIHQILVKNNLNSKERIIEELMKAAQNSEFPPSDDSINVRTTKITTIDTNFPNDNDPLSAVPMSRVSTEAKQKMAEIAKQDINKQLEENVEKFASIFPDAVEYTDEYFKPDYSNSETKPKRKYTKKPKK